MLCSSPAMSGIYKWVDEDGSVHFTQTPPASGNHVTKLKEEKSKKTVSFPSGSKSSHKRASGNSQCDFCDIPFNERKRRYREELAELSAERNRLYEDIMELKRESNALVDAGRSGTEEYKDLDREERDANRELNLILGELRNLNRKYGFSQRSHIH